MQSIQNQRVLVIGGSSGIGYAVADLARHFGGTVTIASRNPQKLDAAAKKLDGSVSTALIDTGDEELLEEFFSKHEPWDHIVVSAAQTKSGPVLGLEMSKARAAMDSKFWGAYRVARAARFRENGSLTFISGYLSERPSATSVLQGAINAALEALARGLALELATVRVNAVSPGLIETPLWSGLPDDKRQALFEATAQKLPVRRIGQPEDIANAVLYLITTSFATGSTVRVDGGGVIA